MICVKKIVYKNENFYFGSMQYGIKSYIVSLCPSSNWRLLQNAVFLMILLCNKLSKSELRTHANC